MGGGPPPDEGFYNGQNNRGRGGPPRGGPGPRGAPGGRGGLLSSPGGRGMPRLAVHFMYLMFPLVL